MDKPTFTESELNKVADFVNYVHQNGTFEDCKKPAQSRKLTKMFNDMHAHLKKCEAYILEIKEIVPPGGDSKVTKARD